MQAPTCPPRSSLAWGRWLQDNSLSGTLSQELIQLATRDSLSLKVGITLSGTIPHTLTKLANLTMLYLSGGDQHGDAFSYRLSGTIPPELAKLTELNYLCVSLLGLTFASPT